MKNSQGRKGLLAACCGIAIFAMTLPCRTAFTADGSGTSDVTPDAVVINSTDNDFDFIYTATEDMGDGSVRMTTPGGFPNPTSGNTTVTVVDGLTGTVLNSLDANPPTGWGSNIHINGIGACVGCDVDLSTDASPVFAGTGSLDVDVTLNVGLNSSVRVYYNFAAPQDWSAYTHMSFYIRKGAILGLDLLTGAAVRIDNSANTASPEGILPIDGNILSLTLLSSGDWTQVIVPLGATPRSAVRSYGLSFPNLVGVGLVSDIHLDHFMLGPSGPVFSGNTVRQDLIYLDDGGTVTFNYDNVTAPGAPGTYTFPIAQQEDSSGPLTPILSSPSVEVVSDVETLCHDGLDNDLDGGVDCADSDCTGDAACLPEPNCTNGVDDDFDGFIDCLDSDCAANPACEEVETDCTNGVDDDTDEDTDCEDSDCDTHPACNPEPICTDNIDNDLDGDIDCEDTDCAAAPNCLPETACNDGLDNDIDGDADCEDSDCAAAPNCNPETDCDNGTDDDLDGDTDCEDSDCTEEAVCIPETNCNNGVDDDADDATDCEDSDCDTHPACNPETVCNDGIDNDIDSDIDCEDGDCEASPFCEPETDCDDDVDNDGDGLQDCLDTDCAEAEECEDVETNCVNDVDDDGDTDVDCDDADCAAHPACNPEDDCNDGDDNDLDGATDCSDSDCAASPDCPGPEDDCTNAVDDDSDGDVDCDDSDCSSDDACNPEDDCNDGDDNDLDGATDCGDADCADNAACDEPDGDDDGDGVPNGEDNCVGVANADQADADGDGIGDVCDDDFNLAGGDDGPGAGPGPGTPLQVQGGSCTLTAGIPSADGSDLALASLFMVVPASLLLMPALSRLRLRKRKH